MFSKEEESRVAAGSEWWPHRRWESELTPDQRTMWEAALQAASVGRYREAEQQLQQLLGRLPDFVPALSKLGAVLAAQGRREEARHWLDQALARDPNYPPALNNKGNLLLDSGEIEAAIALYRSALAIDEGYSTARHNLAVALKRAGDVDGFVREYKRARRGRLAELRGEARRPPGGCLPGVVVTMLLAVALGALVVR
ncbi:MAG TPA: tetratricopeptide repeat protein [Bacillota bacterium]